MCLLRGEDADEPGAYRKYLINADLQPEDVECYIVVFLLVNESQNALHVSSKEKLLDGATPFAQKFELLSSPSALLGLEFFWNLLFPAQFRAHQAALASLLVYLYLNCRQSKFDFIDKCL